MSTKQLYEKTSEGMKEVSPLVAIEDIYSKLSDTPLEALVSLYNHVKCEWKGSIADTRRTVPLFLRRSGLFITYNNGTKYITEFFSAGTDQITTEGWVKDSNWTSVPDEDYVSAGVKPGVGSIGYEQLSDNLKQLFKEKVNVTNFPDDEDIASVDNMLKFKDREADAANFQSKGYVILRKNLHLVNGVVNNILIQDMINQANTIYVIQYDFTLGEDITIPENCVLKFDGGSISGGYTINFNKCGIKASKGNTIFGETLNIKGLQYAHASWLGIIPAAVSSDSGSSKFIHFCSSPDCDSFELEFDRAEYTFALHEVLLNKWMKLKGAPNRSTKWFVTIDDSCDYVIGINRHCSVSNFDIKLISAVNETGVDFFRVSNEWSDIDDGRDTFRVNYDYCLDNIWFKGIWKDNRDYSTSINGFAVRFKDKEVNEETYYPLLFISGPQHCNNITFENLRAGIVIECIVNSNIINNSYVNDLVFNNIFITALYGFEFKYNSKTPASGRTAINNYIFQGAPSKYGLYGIAQNEIVSNYFSWDNGQLGCIKGYIYISNCNFEPYVDTPTPIKNGFEALDGTYADVYTISRKVNSFKIFPNSYNSDSDTQAHIIDFSEKNKIIWSNNRHNQEFEKQLEPTFFASKKCSNNRSNIIEKTILEENLSSLKTYHNSVDNTTFVLDKTKNPNFGKYQDSAIHNEFDKYGFFNYVFKFNSYIWRIGDTLTFDITLSSNENINFNTFVCLIKNIFFTGGTINIVSITDAAQIANPTSIIIRCNITLSKPNIKYDVIGFCYKLINKKLTNEVESDYIKDKTTITVSTPLLLRHANGTRDERPTSGLYVGMQYFDTTLNKPIWYKDNNVWVDATGTTV